MLSIVVTVLRADWMPEAQGRQGNCPQAECVQSQSCPRDQGCAVNHATVTVWLSSCVLDSRAREPEGLRMELILRNSTALIKHLL